MSTTLARGPDGSPGERVPQSVHRKLGPRRLMVALAGAAAVLAPAAEARATFNLRPAEVLGIGLLLSLPLLHAGSMIPVGVGLESSRGRDGWRTAAYVAAGLNALQGGIALGVWSAALASNLREGFPVGSLYVAYITMESLAVLGSVLLGVRPALGWRHAWGESLPGRPSLALVPAAGHGLYCALALQW